MNQLDLFNQRPRQPEPPHNGSATSREAAEEIEPTAATLRAKVFDFIKKHGSNGATDQEIQIALQMQGNTQRPRRKELEEAGLITDSGETRKTTSGRSAIVWIAKGN